MQRRSEALRRILFQAAQDHALDERVQLLYELRRGRWRALIAQASHLFTGGSIEGAFAGEYLVEDKAERVKIAFRRHVSARELFGRHVGWRACPRVGSFDFSGQPGQTKIRDAHAPAPIQHDVRGFQVAMNNAVLVRGREACAHLSRDFEGFVRRQPADAAHQRSEIFAVHKLHGQERVCVGLASVASLADFADIEHAADVRMRNLSRQTYFTREPRARLFCLCQRPW